MSLTCPRPSWVMNEGGFLSVTAHDAYFRAELAKFKERLKTSHPDYLLYVRSTKRGKPVTGDGFRRTARKYRIWLEKERQWYAKLGLGLPKHGA